jgi:hypothetical protein
MAAPSKLSRDPTIAENDDEEASNSQVSVANDQVSNDDEQTSDGDDESIDENAVLETERKREEDMDAVKTLVQILSAVSLSPDVDSSDEDMDSSSHDLDDQDVVWHKKFHPKGRFDTERTKNPPLSEIELPHGKQVCSKYVNHINSYHALTLNLIGDELIASNALKGAQMEQLMSVCYEVLFPMDTRVVHCLIRGDLSFKYRNDPTIRRIMDGLWQSQHPPVGNKYVPVQPALYIQYLVNEAGEGLEGSQRETIISRIRDYCNGSDHEYAFRVDSWKTNAWTKYHSHQGHRKHLSKSVGDQSISNRKTSAYVFCDALEKNTRAVPNCKLVPLREVGYSSRAHRRLQEHRCHYKSNFLMHLIEAICHVEFPNKFHWDQYVVARLYDSPQAPVGEILLTRLADSK